MIGFLSFENRLKPETREVIKQLNNSDFKSVMITGDNPLTSIHVGRECQIISEESPVFLIEKLSSNRNEEFSISKIEIGCVKQEDTIISTKNKFIEEIRKLREKFENYSFSLTGLL